MRRSLLVFAALAALPAAALAGPPADSRAGGLPACLEDVDAAAAEIDALTADLAAAQAKIEALAKENEALRAAALPSPFELDDVLERIPLGGGDAFDKEALAAFAKAFGPLAAAAEDLDLAGAVLTLGDDAITVHLLGRDGKRHLRSGSTMTVEPGGDYTTTAPKIMLNP